MSGYAPVQGVTVKADRPITTENVTGYDAIVVPEGRTAAAPLIPSVRFVADQVTVWDANVVTSQGPCAPHPFAFKYMEVMGIDPQPIKDRLLYAKAGGR